MDITMIPQHYNTLRILLIYSEVKKEFPKKEIHSKISNMGGHCTISHDEPLNGLVNCYAFAELPRDSKTLATVDHCFDVDGIHPTSILLTIFAYRALDFVQAHPYQIHDCQENPIDSRPSNWTPIQKEAHHQLQLTPVDLPNLFRQKHPPPGIDAKELIIAPSGYMYNCTEDPRETPTQARFAVTLAICKSDTKDADHIKERTAYQKLLKLLRSHQHSCTENDTHTEHLPIGLQTTLQLLQAANENHECLPAYDET